jgi:surface antigen
VIFKDYFSNHIQLSNNFASEMKVIQVSNCTEYPWKRAKKKGAFVGNNLSARGNWVKDQTESWVT